jgi:hypothetical protein
MGNAFFSLKQGYEVNQDIDNFESMKLKSIVALSFQKYDIWQDHLNLLQEEMILPNLCGI